MNHPDWEAIISELETPLDVNVAIDELHLGIEDLYGHCSGTHLVGMGECQMLFGWLLKRRNDRRNGVVR